MLCLDLSLFFYFSDTHIKAKISNADLLKSPEQFNESKSGVFLISAELEIIKGKLEMLNGLVSDVKASLENEIKIQDESSIDIVFENILTAADDSDDIDEKSFTSSATNASLDSMYKTVKNMQQIIKEVDLAL